LGFYSSKNRIYRRGVIWTGPGNVADSSDLFQGRRGFPQFARRHCLPWGIAELVFASESTEVCLRPGRHFF
jgi:hypothetical protein